MKKLVAALLAVSLLASAVFAGGSKEKKTATADASGKFPKGTTVNMGFMTWVGRPQGTDRVLKAINAITEERYGITVDAQILDFGAYMQNLNLMLAAGEKLDLFNITFGVGYLPSVNKGYCLDLEENNLIQTYGKDILRVVRPEYIDSCRVNGTLYGLPQMRDMAVGLDAFAIPAEYLDKIGFDYNKLYKNGEEIIYTDYDTIEDIFARLHKAYPNKYVIQPQEATFHSQGELIDEIGSDQFGVLLDPEHSLKVENLYASKIFKDQVTRYYNWNQKGYISKDALTETLGATQLVKAGTVMCYQTATKPGIRAQESGLIGMPVVIFQVGKDFMRSDAVANIPWAINSNTDVPEAAMTILNAFYSDPVLSNLICWGEEGVDYKKTADGHITFADGVNPENAQWFNNVNWQFPNQFIAHVFEGDDLDIWERMEKFNDNAAKSKAMGFSFISSDVAVEYTALMNVYNQYCLPLCFGFVNPETGIPEFNAALEKAGLQKYMAEKQKQLDAWAKANNVK